MFGFNQSLPENELLAGISVNELIILYEFVIFFFETNDIILENVCNWRRNRLCNKVILSTAKSVLNFCQNFFRISQKGVRNICPSCFGVNVKE